MKPLIAAAVLFCGALAGVAQLGPSNPPPTVTLAWDPSPGTDIASYNIYYGPGSGVYTAVVSVGNVTNATLVLEFGREYYFAATALNTAGLESEFSNEVAYITPSLPLPPWLRIVLKFGGGKLGISVTNASPLTVYSLDASPQPWGPWAPVLDVATNAAGEAAAELDVVGDREFFRGRAGAVRAASSGSGQPR